MYKWVKNKRIENEKYANNNHKQAEVAIINIKSKQVRFQSKDICNTPMRVIYQGFPEKNSQQDVRSIDQSFYLSIHLSIIFLSREIYFKELVHLIVGVGNSKICRQVGRLDAQGNAGVIILNLETAWRWNSFFLGGLFS